MAGFILSLHIVGSRRRSNKKFSWSQFSSLFLHIAHDATHATCSNHPRSLPSSDISSVLMKKTHFASRMQVSNPLAKPAHQSRYQFGGFLPLTRLHILGNNCSCVSPPFVCLRQEHRTNHYHSNGLWCTFAGPNIDSKFILAAKSQNCCMVVWAVSEEDNVTYHDDNQVSDICPNVLWTVIMSFKRCRLKSMKGSHS